MCIKDCLYVNLSCGMTVQFPVNTQPDNVGIIVLLSVCIEWNEEEIGKLLSEPDAAQEKLLYHPLCSCDKCEKLHIRYASWHWIFFPFSLPVFFLTASIIFSFL